MRKALSLIELIFTIVIIAMVFTVIPKIIYAVNKSDSFTIRQDALLNGVSMLHMISNMPWDKNNADSSSILGTDSNNSHFDCNSTTHYRKGGFIGSRNCIDDLNASTINNTLNNGDGDNIGDFNNADINITAYGAQIYELNITVRYANDDNTSIFHYNQNQNVHINLSTSNENNTTNLKRIEVKVLYHGKRGKARTLAKFNYTSANIGLVTINKRVWK